MESLSSKPTISPQSPTVVRAVPAPVFPPCSPSVEL